MMQDQETGYRRSTVTLPDQAARGLGYFSLALGATELLFPGLIARTLGLKSEGVLRAYGLREIAAGIGALQPNPGPAMWSRVAGDVIDLATLTPGLNADNEKRRNATTAIAVVAAITAIDVLVAAALTKQNTRSAGPPRDFSDRTGFPKGVDAVRGAAAGYRGPDFMRAPREGGGPPVETPNPA